MKSIQFRAWDTVLNEYPPNVQNHIGTSPTAFGHMLRDKERWVIEQFTGLKDKNGVAIYEGDIVREDGGMGVITWEEDRASFMCELRTGTCGLYLQQMDIIGNVHENPELIRCEGEN